MQAQNEAKAIGLYQCPKGKMKAAARCCQTVLRLLEVADERHSPAADDIVPVLQYVLIKVW